MYMLLIVYSFININNVSWGTRENILTPTEQLAAQKEAAEQAAKAEQQGRRKSFVDMITSMWKGNDSPGR